MAHSMNIGEAAKAAGVSAKMIRHYEQIGLLPAADRSDSGYRLYSEREVSVLRFVRQSRRLGFSIPQIAALIGLWGDQQRSSREVKRIAQHHLDDLEEKLREIAEMKAGLEQLVRACQGDDSPHCAIIENLAVHSPASPAAAARIVKPGRRKADAADRAETAQGGNHGAHIDLMAWMRSVHPHQGHH